MALYGYDENEHLKIEAEAIDKDGFHKKVEIENGSGSSSSGFEENLFVNPEAFDGGSTMNVSMIFNPVSHFNNVNFRPGNNGRQYLYFGDIIEDNAFILENDETIIITNADELGLIGYVSGGEMVLLKDHYVATYTTFLIESSGESLLPEGWENMKAHVVFTGTVTDGNDTEYAVMQIHQK